MVQGEIVDTKAFRNKANSTMALDDRVDQCNRHTFLEVVPEP